MADKPLGKSSQRSRLAKIFLGNRKKSKSQVAPLTLLEILIGVGIALAVTSLLVGFEFLSIPDYQIGDIADRTIEAPRDFTIEDREATFQAREEIRETVPVIFDLDLRVNSRTTAELRSAFAEARRLIAEDLYSAGLLARDSRSHWDNILSRQSSFRGSATPRY
ncbi:MAG: hypothetical protein ACE1ZI_03695, partial [Acidobacteriota bacterium]